VADTGFRLGIDFGTSNTVAVLRWPDGRTKPLLFDGSPLLPSAVYVDPTGPILTGRDAVHSARLQPHRFEPYPKRRVEEGTVWLGERDIAVVDLIATVLRRVATEAARVAGTRPAEVNITHPAAWAPQRREALTRAALAAGLPAPFLTPEPVAAASYFVGTVGTHVPVGGYAVVYDFGAGTFDASVVRRNAGGGFDVLSSEGLEDAGGLDVDAAVVAYLGKQFDPEQAPLWQRLSQPGDENDRRAAWQLWEDARQAKEMLSRAATTYVHVPLLDESVPLGREQLEELARPILDRTVTSTQLAVSGAGLQTGQLAAIFLVGGSSRIPLAATLLHRAFGLAPTAIEQPELVVAEGALHLAPPTGRAPVSGVPAPSSGAPFSTPTAVPATPPISAPPTPVSPASVSGAPARPFSGPPVSPPGPAFGQQLPPPPGYNRPPVYAAPPAPAKKSRTGLIVAGVGGGALVLILVVVLVIVAVTAGNGDGGKKHTAGGAAACGYKLAYLGVLSGDNASDGTMIRNSAKMAVDKYNDNHAGCTVTLEEFDTQQKDDLSKSQAQKVVGDAKILGVIGPVYRSEVLAADPVLNDGGVTMITPSASDAELSRKGWKVFHRDLGTDADQAVAGAQYLKSVLKVTKTYIVTDDTEFGSTASAEVRRSLGSTNIGSVSISRDDTDYGAAVKQVTDAGADSVYFAGYYDDGGAFVKQLKAANAKIAVVSGDKIFTQSFIDAAGSGSEGVVMTCPCIPADQAGANFAANYQKKFSDDASYYGPEAFDATNILLAGLDAGKATRADMLNFVNAYQGKGVARDIKFTVSGDLDVSDMRIWSYKVDNGDVNPDEQIPS
jgi:ABC-type branched-subunit amino acid transport system substrate-binding protein